MKLPHTSRQIYNMMRLEESLKSYQNLEDSHIKAQKDANEDSAKPKSGKFDANRMEDMAKPKIWYLKKTLDDYRQFMSLVKQKRINCQLGKTEISLEKLEGIMRKSKETKVRDKRDDALKLLRQIKKKIASDVFDEMCGKIQKKLPRLIINHKNPTMISANVQKLHKSAFNLVVAANGPRANRESYEKFCNFAGVISDFVMKTLADSMDLRKTKRSRRVQQLQSVEKNKDLLTIANNLMQKL
jgi:hypothetical protein